MTKAEQAGRIAVCLVLLVLALWLWMSGLRAYIAWRRRARVRHDIVEDLETILADEREEDLRNDIARFRARHNL
jgi:hypothetical protein